MMSISEKLNKAREYEKEKYPQTIEQKPVFHFAVPTGWMNDPNGFSFFNNECHLFFQYNPYYTNWGPMHWGHTKTNDFINWKILPCAMAPDAVYDEAGCFSGTAIEHDGKHLIMYTGVQEKTDSNGNKFNVQTQCMATGDGIEYKKLETNPVIDGTMLPEGSSINDFRDPKIWKDEKGFWSLVGSVAPDKSGQLALFYSENATEWKFMKIIDYCKNQYGKMWECPDFFGLDGRQILIVSPQFMQSDGDEFHCGNVSMYFVGDWDSNTLEWKRNKPFMLDYGLDFYAPETVQTPDGRRVMIGWLQNWDNHILPDGQTWSGIMTVPRELKVCGEKLIQNPVRELENYRCNKFTAENVCVPGDGQIVELEGLRGRILDMTLCIKNSHSGCLSTFIAADEKHQTKIILDLEKCTVTIDRSRSGLFKDFITTRSMKIDGEKDEIKLRILMDKWTVEVFANDGESVMTSLIYTPVEADRIYWTSTGVLKMEVKKYEIKNFM